MAKIQLGVLAQSIRGKIGTGIYQVWKGIQIVRNMPAVISQPNSADQVTYRAKLSEAYEQWSALNGANKTTWAEMAEQVAGYPLPPGGIDNIVPKYGGQQSAFNCYVGHAIAGVIVGGAWPTSAPLTEARPGAPLSVAVTYDNVGHKFTVTWVDPPVADASAKIRIWIRSKHRTYHRQMLNTTYALGVQTADITTANGAGGGAIAFSLLEAAGNERVYFQLDCVNPSGVRSEGSNVDSDNIE